MEKFPEGWTMIVDCPGEGQSQFTRTPEGFEKTQWATNCSPSFQITRSATADEATAYLEKSYKAICKWPDEEEWFPL